VSKNINVIKNKLIIFSEYVSSKRRLFWRSQHACRCPWGSTNFRR